MKSSSSAPASRPISNSTPTNALRVSTSVLSNAYNPSAVAFIAQGGNTEHNIPGTTANSQNHHQSLYHQCVGIIDLISLIPYMDAYIKHAEHAITTSSGQDMVVPIPCLAGGSFVVESQQDHNTSSLKSDPVTLLWTMLRLGEPLAYLFNLIVPSNPIELASGKLASSLPTAKATNQVPKVIHTPSPSCFNSALSTLNSMKALVYHTVVGLRTHNTNLVIFNNLDTDLFTIGELYQDDTSGFLKVLKTVQLLIDYLDKHMDYLFMSHISTNSSLNPSSLQSSSANTSSNSLNTIDQQHFNNFRMSTARSNNNHLRNTTTGAPPRNASSSSDNSLDTLRDRTADRYTTTSVPSKPIKELTHRDKILLEFLQTERKYVADLERLLEYQTHLTINNILTPSVISSIFSNLKALVDVQRGFLIGLETILVNAATGEEKIGSLFVSLESTFTSTYSLFCSNFKRSSDQAVESIPLLQATSSIMEPSHELPSFLIKPIQRICRYPLLLKELIKQTPKSQFPDSLVTDLEDGQAAIMRVVEFINESRRQLENQLVREELSKRIEDWKGHDINSFGLLLLHDRFMMMIQDYERELVIFLFDKIILCCKLIVNTPAPKSNPNSLLKRKSRSKSQQGTPCGSSSSLSQAGSSDAMRADSDVSYQIKGRIWIGGITDLSGMDNDGVWLLTVSWKSPTKIEYFVLKCRNEEQYKLWLSTIQKCVDETRERGRQRFAQHQLLQKEQQLHQAQQVPPKDIMLGSNHTNNISSTRLNADVPPLNQHNNQPGLLPVLGSKLQHPMYASTPLPSHKTATESDRLNDDDDNDKQSFVERDDSPDRNEDHQSPASQSSNSDRSGDRSQRSTQSTTSQYMGFGSKSISMGSLASSTSWSSILDEHMAELALLARGDSDQPIPTPTKSTPPKLPIPNMPEHHDRLPSRDSRSQQNSVAGLRLRSTSRHRSQHAPPRSIIGMPPGSTIPILPPESALPPTPGSAPVHSSNTLLSPNPPDLPPPPKRKYSIPGLARTTPSGPPPSGPPLPSPSLTGNFGAVPGPRRSSLAPHPGNASNSKSSVVYDGSSSMGGKPFVPPSHGIPSTPQVPISISQGNSHQPDQGHLNAINQRHPSASEGVGYPGMRLVMPTTSSSSDASHVMNQDTTSSQEPISPMRTSFPTSPSFNSPHKGVAPSSSSKTILGESSEKLNMFVSASGKNSGTDGLTGTVISPKLAHQSPTSPDSPALEAGINVVKSRVYHSGQVYSLLLSNGMTYSTFVSQIKRKIGRPATANVRIKYEGNSGEFILISSDSDLSTAIMDIMQKCDHVQVPSSVTSSPVILNLFVFDS